MLLNAFLNMLLTLGIIILAGIIALTTVVVIVLLALFIKWGVEIIREKKE